MQIKKYIYVIIILCLFPFAGMAQTGSSLSTFSPYTIYGIGDLATQGTSYFKGMGGIGVAHNSPSVVNTLNPASNGVVAQQTFILDVGVAGGGFYLSNLEGNTSYSAFNMNNISLRFPLTKGLGMTIDVSPYSSIGYNSYEITYYEPDYNAVMTKYSGEGGVSQAKVGVGAKVLPRLSLGVDAIYYFGTINRNFTSTIVSDYEGLSDLTSVAASQDEHASSFFAKFGLQYDIVSNDKRALTFGATYQYQGSLNLKVNRNVPAVGLYEFDVLDSIYTSSFTLPATTTVGFYYQTPKLGVGIDYTYAQWGDADNFCESDYVQYVNTHAIKAGAQYTPNRMDVRRFFNRLTYKLGLSYSTYYMKVYGQDLDSRSLTFGVDVPLKFTGVSMFNVAVELGQMGVASANLYKQEYFKVSLGVSMFGEDYWFLKRRYD